MTNASVVTKLIQKHHVRKKQTAVMLIVQVTLVSFQWTGGVQLIVNTKKRAAPKD